MRHLVQLVLMFIGSRARGRRPNSGQDSRGRGGVLVFRGHRGVAVDFCNQPDAAPLALVSSSPWTILRTSWSSTTSSSPSSSSSATLWLTGEATAHLCDGGGGDWRWRLIWIEVGAWGRGDKKVTHGGRETWREMSATAACSASTLSSRSPLRTRSAPVANLLHLISKKPFGDKIDATADASLRSQEPCAPLHHRVLRPLVPRCRFIFLSPSMPTDPGTGMRGDSGGGGLYVAAVGGCKWR
uniref:Uncharacterized protein n=1 Tax=Arundo donax TaxID=35708 RepID=A0A0A9U4A3_ARUDO